MRGSAKGDEAMQTSYFKTNQKIKPYRNSPVSKDQKLSKRMEGGNSVEFLQKRFFYPTNFKPPAIKWTKKREPSKPESKDEKSISSKTRISNLDQYNKIQHNSGFTSLLLLPFMALMMTGMMGFFSLSLGIKNITRAQTYCIQANLKGQKRLGLLLSKILNLNNKVLLLHNTRKAIEASITAAIFLGQAHLLPILKQKQELIKQAQKALILRQNYLLAQSALTKKKTFQHLKRQFKKLKISHVQDEAFYKKALAIQKKKEGDKAYTYEPVPDFINHQKSLFSWKMRPFSSLDKSLQWLWPATTKNFSSYTCTASLKKKGKQWISALYH